MFLCCAAGPVVKTFEVTSEAITLERTLNSLNSDVSCVRFNHNGRILASSSVEGGICLNVASSGELLSRFFNPGDAPANRVRAAILLCEGTSHEVLTHKFPFITACECCAVQQWLQIPRFRGNDGCVRLWDLKTQEIMQTYNISASAVTSVAFSGYKDEFVVGVHKVMAIQASPHPYARHTLGSTYSDGSVRVWDLSTGQLTAEFVRQHEAPATSLTLSPVSKVLLATGGLDGRVIFYDTLQRKYDTPSFLVVLNTLISVPCVLKQRVTLFRLGTASVVIGSVSDGKTLAVGTTMGEILVYDLRGAITPLFSTLVHETSAVQSLQFSPPASDVVTTGMIPEGVPVVSAEHVSPCKGETLQEIALRKLETLGMGSPTRKYQDQLGGIPSPSLRLEPPEPASPQSHSNGFVPPTQPSSSRPFVNGRSELATVQESTDERRHIILIHIVTKPTGPDNHSFYTGNSPSKQGDFGKTKMRAEIQRLREEMELRRQEEVDQLSTLLETLMDRFDAIVEENRSLRQENEWLKSHVPAS
ncbi:WD40 repeat, conserved site [Phytophthora cactorum]|nr:WD40 repeat, conserved site [Phytophthora cactorum]